MMNYTIRFWWDLKEKALSLLRLQVEGGAASTYACVWRRLFAHKVLFSFPGNIAFGVASLMSAYNFYSPFSPKIALGQLIKTE